MPSDSRIKDTRSSFPAEEPRAVEPCPAAQQPAAPQPAQTQTLAARAEEPPPEQKPIPPEKTWVKIELVDMAGKPIPGERYRIKVPSESTPREGVLDSQGQAAYFDLDPGTCEISFPDLDKEAWEPA